MKANSLVMDQDVISAYRETVDELLETIRQFPEEKINEVPFEGSWTAAQVADHIYKSQEVFPKLLAGASKETTRDTEKKKQQIKSIFLDFSNKMKSPDFIIPTDEPQNKKMLAERMDKKAKEIDASMKAHDLNRTFLDFELPGFGKFTGLEWGWFITYHTQRHIHQMKNILEKFLP
jgi:uncharacterized damage-inducible protein DinB